MSLQQRLLPLPLLLLLPLLAQAAADSGPAADVWMAGESVQGQHGVVPGAVIVDLRHGVLLPQGRSRQELEPVIRDSLRILDFYLHAPEGQKLRRQKRSDVRMDAGPGGEPVRRVKRSAAVSEELRRERRSSVPVVSAAGHREQRIQGSRESKRRAKRSAGMRYYDFGSFAINPPAADMFMAGQPVPGPLGVIPGAIIVDPRHGMLLPQGRSRHELEPVIRDSLRILDLYLHAPEGQKLRREKRSPGAGQGLPVEKPSGVVSVAARRPEQRIPGLLEPRRRLKRSAKAGHFALNSFAINPKPLNKTGTYYTLFAKVSEAMLQDLMAPRRAPSAEKHKHEPPSGRYSGELYNYVRDGTATQKPLVGQRAAAVLPVSTGGKAPVRPESPRDGVKCIYRKNSVLCYQSP